jgi:hypothetical protein
MTTVVISSISESLDKPVVELGGSEAVTVTVEVAESLDVKVSDRAVAVANETGAVVVDMAEDNADNMDNHWP